MSILGCQQPWGAGGAWTLVQTDPGLVHNQLWLWVWLGRKPHKMQMGFHIWWRSDKEFACQCRRYKRHGFEPCVRKIPWSRKWQPAPVFLPGKFHGQRSLEGYSPWGHKESDTTECACMHTHTHTYTYLFTWFSRRKQVRDTVSSSHWGTRQLPPIFSSVKWVRG